MTLAQGLDRGMDQLVRHHHFDLPLRYAFQRALAAEKWLTAGQRPKLALPQHLPGATVISANPPTTGGKHRLFDRFHMTIRYIKTQLVHQDSEAAVALRTIQASEH